MQIHIILGLGYFGSEAFNNPSISGVMADVAASANDPIFLNHHAMVDCIFETWLQKNPNANYPTDDTIKPGHKYDDYIVPFFPLYKHSDMFTTADKFGYQCIIKSSGSVPRWKIIVATTVPIGIILCAVCTCMLGLIGWCIHHCRKSRNKQSHSGSSMRMQPPSEYGTTDDTSVLIRNK